MSSYRIIYPNGTIFWFKVGTREYHREDGPAYKSFNGEEWWVNGKLHRLNGPAIISYGWREKYLVNGKFHRLDGPAINYVDGTKCWYYHGEEIDCKSQEEFERILKLKAFW